MVLNHHKIFGFSWFYVNMLSKESNIFTTVSLFNISSPAWLTPASPSCFCFTLHSSFFISIQLLMTWPWTAGPRIHSVPFSGSSFIVRTSKSSEMLELFFMRRLFFKLFSAFTNYCLNSGCKHSLCSFFSAFANFKWFKKLSTHTQANNEGQIGSRRSLFDSSCSAAPYLFLLHETLSAITRCDVVVGWYLRNASRARKKMLICVPICLVSLSVRRRTGW